MSCTDVIEARHIFLNFRHLYNEICSEYLAFSREQSVDELLQEFSPYFKAKLFDDLDDLISFFQTTDNGCTVDLRPRSTIERNFVLTYDTIKGRSYNDQLTFSQGVVTNMVNILRSYHRFNNTVFVGPTGKLCDSNKYTEM